MANNNNLFAFASGSTTTENHSPDPWLILSVEDDPDYQASLAMALEFVEVAGRPVQLLRAGSAFEAARLIPEHPDISVILLDVVMESDDAGLSLVRTIREVIGNTLVRIVLLTGQPGMAPRLDVMREYDIDDYWNKAELTHEHLASIITGNIRSWDRSSQLERARQGLQIITEASRVLGQKRDIRAFTRHVLEHLARLVGAANEGVACVRYPSENLEAASIIEASGSFEACAHRCINELPDSRLKTTIQQYLARPDATPEGDLSVFDFSRNEKAGEHYLAVLKTTRPLSIQESNLLEVFCENASAGLTNLRLASRLHKLAYRDPELDLPNRNQFLRYLGQHLRSQARKRHLMVLQLYEFNEMAFQLGDRFASQILSGVAQTLRNILSNPDGCARVDRSSFAALMESPAACHELAEALNQPIETEGGSYRVSICSVCLPLEEFGEEQTSTLLNTAEIAMEQARENRSNPLFFSHYDQAPILERYALLTRLRQALDDHSLDIFLQPKVELETGLLAGFEALVRWPQADGSYIRPDQFIPIAEHGGLIGELDLQVLDKTLQTIQLLQEQGIHTPVAFNASPLDLFEPSHFETMLRMISDSGINPTLLELEVTESRAMEEYDMISERLQQLMDMGVGVSIDDFGTGYSSLGHITHLAASTLKIDRSFVFRMEESTDAVHVVDMILRLSRRFSFKVVAEGVETDTQRKLLLELGCSIGQGYLFSPPLPVNDAVDWALHHSS